MHTTWGPSTRANLQQRHGRARPLGGGWARRATLPGSGALSVGSGPSDGGPHQPCPEEADLALAPPCGLEPPCPLSPPAERLNQATFPDPVGGLPGILLECMPVTSHRGPDSYPRQEGQESAFLCLGLKCWTGPPRPPSRSDIVRPETALTPSLATAAPSELGRWGARGLRGPSCLGSCPPQEPGKPVFSPTAPTHSERFSKNGDEEGVLS